MFCTYTFCCMPCAFGQVGQLLDDQNRATVFFKDALLTYFLACCCVSKDHRDKMRAKYNITGDTEQDVWANFLCCCCANCQHYNEIQKRKNGLSGQPLTSATG